MKNIKRLLYSIVILALVLTVIPIKPIHANTTSSNNTCDFSEPKVISSNIGENGYEVKTFDDKVEVVYLENDGMIIKDYGHVYDTLFNTNAKPRDTFFNNNAQPRIAWVLLAKVFIGAASTCSTVQYVTNVDACRIVLKYLGTNRRPNVKYELTGRFISGKIPGCEPSHSGPCNSGYWEYRVVRV